VLFFLKGRQGERHYFIEGLIETFMLLLRTDMLIKAGSTHTALTQMSKHNLFLQHDMKNIAQFIQLAADHLQGAPAGSEQQVLNYLRTATPLIRERADRIVRTLMDGQPKNSALRHYRLQDEIGQLCQLHRLDCEIRGAADMLAPEHALDSVLDNLLKNYRDCAPPDDGRQPSVRIEISDNGNGVDIRFESRQTPCDIPLERLFEPFWSSNPNGMGIGLYQAKQSLEMHGGKLFALKTGGGALQFRVSLPGEVTGTTGQMHTQAL
ncbi:MAG: ATP-binding protein, partial [Betaproteobacteria bacterium]